MSKHNTMTYKETVEELEFAIERNLRFSKHDIERILPKEDAKKSIKENERDWKIYFGIKEWE